MSTKYTKELLETAVKESKSIADVMRYFNLRASGGNQTHMRKRLDKLGIDTSHFTGQGHNKGRVAGNRKDAEAILVILPDGSNRPKRAQLLRALAHIGIPYECLFCKNPGEWTGKKLCLEIDHINRNWYDNRKENLRFLCPNCHSQV